MSGASLIAIDWGTTSARAYRLDARGGVLDERTAPLGISQVPSGRYNEALSALLGEWSSERAPRLACGMIGSRQGWIEAPYVACPASIDALVDGIAAVHTSMLSIVPGLNTRDRHGTPDVMRGEETQLVGAVDVDESMVLAVLPGTHSKWARMERGRVVDFSTYMTGELYGVLLAHSILGRMSERSLDARTEAAFLRGVDRGLKNDGITHAIFGARTLVLAGEMAASDVDDWLSGTLIGTEISAALAHAGVTTEQGDRHAAARGLWRIATRAGFLH